MRELSSAALSIALLGAIESLLRAVVADGMVDERHNSNTELVAQGIANIISPIMGGIAVTGAVARTATSIKNGGNSPMADIMHAIILLLIILFFGQWVQHIPIAGLDAILILVAYNMLEWRSFLSLLKKKPRSDAAVLVATFLLTVFLDLAIAIQVGMVLAIMLFMRRMIMATEIQSISGEIWEEPTAGDNSGMAALSPHEIPEDVEIYEINGPFFFGIANKFEESLEIVQRKPKAFILRMRHVPFIDATALRSLEEFYSRLKKNNIPLILSGVNETVRRSLKESKLCHELGEQNICPHISIALQWAREIEKAAQ